jgi:DNA-binding NarL/FixJ family response regulator
MDEPIGLFVVTSFEPLEAGLSEVFRRAPGIELVGSASAFEATNEAALAVEPDVWVVDVQVFAGNDGMGSAGFLAHLLQRPRVLLLGTMEFIDTITFEAMLPVLTRMDGVGYLFKDGPTWRLLEAVRLIAAGAFVCETAVLKAFLTRATHADSSSRSTEQLSERQNEILHLVADGYSNKEIARELSLSESTVKAHVSQVMAKLSLVRRTELVRWALTSGAASDDGEPRH